MSTAPYALPTEIVAGLRELVATLRRQIADPDPKVSHKAAAEFTKLIATCTRARVELPDASPAAPAPAAPDANRQKKADTLTAALRPRTVEPNARSLPAPTPFDPDPLPPPLPGGGKPFTSFLGVAKNAAPIRPPTSG